MKLDHNWSSLTDLNQIEEIIAVSQEDTVLIFKHSTTCGISNHVLTDFQTEKSSLIDKNVKLYYLDLLKNRAISNAIADQFSVIHQSPQVIAIKNGKAVYNSSHFAIKADEIAKNL